MTYVMSDIHGEIERFEKMLELIEFSEQDQLYIIGDVVDRAPDGVRLLLDIMNRPNITMVLGNHEQMMLDTFARDSYPEARLLWAQNGGNVTRRELLYRRTSADRNSIMRFCRGLPTQIDVTVGEKTYRLVHGHPSDKELDRIWGRVTPESKFPGANYIMGHTPTCYLTGVFNQPYTIFRGEGFIDIDCGCGNMTNPFRRLACLRLDDEKEFYI